MRDLRKNKRMAVYGTYDGFGTEGITDEASKGNILLANTGLKWKDQDGVEHPVTANDLFRAVHDAFGHGLEGAGFRAQGEENAWQAHARLFTGPALQAMTSETRGQNSWLNYGKYGEQNKNATIEDTIFAPQKIGLMPEWTSEEGLQEPKGIVLGKKQAGAQTYEGIHYSNAERQSLDGKKFGSGLKGAESKRLAQAEDPRVRSRVYFYIPDDLTGKNLPKEAGLGMYAHKQTFSNILPSGTEMKRLNAEAGGDANKFESAVIDAGYDGYAVPSMGMMVILNQSNVPVKPRGTQAEMKVRGEKFQIKPEDISKIEAGLDGYLTQQEEKLLENYIYNNRGRNELGRSLESNDAYQDALQQNLDAIEMPNTVTMYRGRDVKKNWTDSEGKYLNVSSSKRLAENFRKTSMTNLKNWVVDKFLVPKDAIIGLGHAEEQEFLVNMNKGVEIVGITTEPETVENVIQPKLQIKPPNTKEFKQWFGDSKVVDDAGNPLVVYHATTNFDGNEFKPSKKVNRSGNPDGYYFTYDIEDANRYAGTEEGAEIIPAFLSIKNPYPYGQKNVHTKAMVDQFEKELRSQVDLDRLGMGWYNEKVDVFKQGRFPNITFSTDAMTRVIQAGGYDGMIDGRDFVAFKPNQIKSAFNQKPTESADIRFQLKPQQDFDVEETGRKDNLIFLLQDKQIDLKRIIDGLKAQGKEIADKWNAYLQEELFHGRSATRVKFFINRELNPLLSQMNSAGITLEQMDDYLLARHAKEANEYIRSINKDPKANAGMTDAEAEAYIKAIPPMRRQVFERLAGEVDKMTKETRQMMVDYGLETQATIDAWEKTYKNYVPLFREET
jgi:hypothetical protein